MLPRFAIVRFPSDNSLKIARTEWIADLDEAISSVEQMDFNEICVIQWPDNSKAMVENDLIESNATNLCDVYLVEFGDLQYLKRRLPEHANKIRSTDCEDPIRKRPKMDNGRYRGLETASERNGNYAVVEFPDSHQVEAIPSCWLIFESDIRTWCWWPRTFVARAIKQQELPGDNWLKFPCRVLKSDISTYDTAVWLAKRAEDTSDLESIESSTGSSNKMPKLIRPVPPDALSRFTVQNSQETAGQTIRPVSLTPTRRSSTPPGPKMMMPRSSGEYQSIRPREPSSIVPSPSAMSSPSVMSSQCNMSSPLAVQSMATAAEKLILRKLNEIKAELKVQKDALASLSATIAEGKGKSSRKGAPFPLPLDSEEQLAQIEGKLAQTQFFESMVAHLSFIGGSTAEKATRNVLTEVISNRLARKFNFRGRQNKMAFDSLLLHQVIRGSVRGNSRTRSAANDDIDDAIKDWLKNANKRKLEEGNSGNYESSAYPDANLAEDRLPSNNDHEDGDVSGDDDQIAALIKSCRQQTGANHSN